MKIAFVIAAIMSTTSVAVAANSIEPIPGSITYGGQPHQRLTKSPIGSQVPHEFVNNFGERVHEVYIVQPDRSLKLVSRTVEDPFSDN